MKSPSQRLTELQSIFERRANKGCESFGVADYCRGDVRLLADALRRLAEFERVFGEGS